MKRLLVPLAGLGLVGAGFGAGVVVSSAAADDEPAPAVTVSRQSLAEAVAPSGAPQRTLGLSEVTVMPGAELASHRHPGTQIGYVAEGVLTYTVETGRARLMAGPGDDAELVRVVKPGQTVRVRPGHWLVEEQGEVHHARNAGSTPITLYVSTLFRTGAAAAIPD